MPRRAGSTGPRKRAPGAAGGRRAAQAARPGIATGRGPSVPVAGVAGSSRALPGRCRRLPEGGTGRDAPARLICGPGAGRRPPSGPGPSPPNPVAQDGLAAAARGAAPAPGPRGRCRPVRPGAPSRRPCIVATAPPAPPVGTRSDGRWQIDGARASRRRPSARPLLLRAGRAVLDWLRACCAARRPVSGAVAGPGPAPQPGPGRAAAPRPSRRSGHIGPDGGGARGP